MRLVFVTGSLVHGGAERHTIGLVNRLAQRGHDCHVGYVQDDPSQLGRLQQAASAECLRARRYLDLRALARLSALIARVRPAAVIAANPYALMYCSLALRCSGRRAALVVTFHTTLLPNAREWLKMLYYRAFFWSADCLVFLCEAQRRRWLRRLVVARSNHVIYNGIDPEYWRSPGLEVRSRIRRLLGLTDEHYAIGMCGVLRPEKNPLQLVDALAYLRGRAIPARALFIGDGPMRQAIEARARALRLDGEVLVSGMQQDVRPLVAACDAIALSSTAETFSLAALEAMALGRPVVLSDVGGAAEMVRSGAEGFLFPAGDTRALVERLVALADESVRRPMGAAAREAVLARFSEAAMVDRYEALLQELVLTRRQSEDLRRSAAAH